MIQKLNFGTALGALVLFFLPWLDFQCKGESFFTQTGIQTITGKASPSKQLEDLAESMGSKRDKAKKTSPEKTAPKAILVAGALVAIVLAMLLALHSMRSAGGKHTNLAGILLAIALGLLITQMVIEFPAVQDMNEGMREGQRQDTAEKGLLGTMSSGAVISNIQTKYLPAFYAELALLVLPSLLVVNGLLDRIKKE